MRPPTDDTPPPGVPILKCGVQHSDDGTMICLVHELEAPPFRASTSHEWPLQLAEKIHEELGECIRKARLAQSGIVLPTAGRPPH